MLALVHLDQSASIAQPHCRKLTFKGPWHLPLGQCLVTFCSIDATLLSQYMPVIIVTVAKTIKEEYFVLSYHLVFPVELVFCTSHGMTTKL